MAEPGPFARTLIRLYLMLATAGAVIALPCLVMFGWYGFEFTKSEWPGNWFGWACYALFSAVLVGGPFIGWPLFRRGRPWWALAVSALGFLIAPLIALGLLFG
jgi:hypothetical protein